MPTAEGTAGEAAQRLGRRLPEAALIGLRAAFAEEVAERLPRVLTAAQTLSAEDLRSALRDVHTLGSSAYVVGEDEAARIARAAELVLTEQGPPEQFRRLVAALAEQLGSWLP